jgi:hypothetical protein
MAFKTFIMEAWWFLFFFHFFGFESLVNFFSFQSKKISLIYTREMKIPKSICHHNLKFCPESKEKKNKNNLACM